MKWFRDRTHDRTRESDEMIVEEVEVQPRAPDPPSRRLALLVQDAIGLAAYRLHTFEDAPAAEDFVQFWFPPGIDHGILAFWTAHQEPTPRGGPKEGAEAEVVVLIRDQARPDIVCPFSFPDMGLAHSWLAQEASRGLDLRLVLLYWVVPVQIETDRWGKVRLTPAEPPPSRQPERAAEQALKEPLPKLVRDEEAPSGANAVWPEWPVQKPEAPAEADDVGDAFLTEVAGEALAAPGEPAGTEEPVATDEPASTEELAASDEPATTVTGGASEREISEAIKEIERMIRKSRWKQQDGPFRGFGSPPGKF